jgi:hypothetical protein
MITVRVENKLKVSIRLHLDRFIPGNFGEREVRRIGSPVELRPGVNEVDAGFWRQWAAAHAGEPLAASFAVIEPEEDHADPLPVAPLMPSSGSSV